MSKKRSIKEVQDFRDSVKRVVALLSGKNIPVAERGDDAYVRYNDDGGGTAEFGKNRTLS